MTDVQFDFERIATIQDFYKSFQSTFSLDGFGNNLDALYDSLTGSLPIPMNLRFVNMSLPQLEHFQALIDTCSDAQDALEGQLDFQYSIRPIW